MSFCFSPNSMPALKLAAIAPKKMFVMRNYLLHKISDFVTLKTTGKYIQENKQCLYCFERAVRVSLLHRPAEKLWEPEYKDS